MQNGEYDSNSIKRLRKIVVVNLDPDNDNMGYKCDIDIKDLISVSDVSKYYKLGPNGSLIYCLQNFYQIILVYHLNIFDVNIHDHIY